MTQPHPARRRSSSHAGFTLLELVLAFGILMVAVLASMSSTTGARSLAHSEGERSLALSALARLEERLRADSDWGGLYARLRARTRESAGDTALRMRGVDAGLPTYDVSAYYDDLPMPAELGDVTVLVQVPAYAASVLGTPTLREDHVAPRYGLPADLNGNGVIETTSRESDYRALPVVLRLRWQRRGQDAQEIVAATWLRGER